MVSNPTHNVVHSLALLLSVICAVFTVSTQADTGLQSVLQVSDAYVRVPVPGQSNSAAYMQMRNTGAQDIVLVAVETSLSNRAELHSHRREDGVMRMRHEEKLVIPAGQTVVLEPGGLHIMLFDLARTIRTGDRVSLQLVDAQDRRLTVDAAVKSLFDEEHHHHH